MANPNPSPATRFKPGQSGNPGGRSKTALSDAMLKHLTPESADQIMSVVTSLALKGEAWAIQMLWDRSEGKPVGRNETGQPGDFTGLEDVPTDELLKLVKRQA
jgi:hypothetical protein